MEERGVGIDLAEVSRFTEAAGDRAHPFLLKTFTSAELEYCFAYADPAPHLAGMFAAKEAAWKALGDSSFLFTILEIRHAASGAPEVWKDGVRLPLALSISHTATLATAIAMR